jgi:hypothetical protein
MFSSDQTLLRAAIAYLRLAIPIKLDARELAEAAATVETLRTFAPNDPGTRFFDLAVQLNAGDESARAKIEAMEREARAELDLEGRGERHSNDGHHRRERRHVALG